MLLKLHHVEAIAAGKIDLAFRRWKRPTVKPGGTLHTRVGVLAIDAVDRIAMKDITERDANRAGYDSRSELLAELKKREGQVYRITLHHAGDDPRKTLRTNAKLTKDDVAEITRRLDRFDDASRRGPWTSRTLQLIASHPATLAATLAESAGWEKKWFKTNVRKLKELGLTESLDIGYRLSPRGKAYFRKSGR